MANKLFFGFTVDDVGYDGYSTAAHVRNILDFCDAQGFRANVLRRARW